MSTEKREFETPLKQSFGPPPDYTDYTDYKPIGYWTDGTPIFETSTPEDPDHRARMLKATQPTVLEQERARFFNEDGTVRSLRERITSATRPHLAARLESSREN